MSDSKIYFTSCGKEIMEHGVFAYSHFFAVGDACTFFTSTPQTDSHNPSRQINIHEDNYYAQRVTVTPINACHTTGLLLDFEGEHFVCRVVPGARSVFSLNHALELTQARIVPANGLDNPAPELPRGLKSMRVYSHCNAALVMPTR